MGFARSPAASLRGRVRGGRRRREVERPHAVVEDPGENADEGPVDGVVRPVLPQDPANLRACMRSVSPSTGWIFVRKL